MKWRKKIVIATVIVLIVLSVGSIIFYSTLNPAGQRMLLFFLVVASAWTSLGGVYWALFGVYSFRGTIDQAQREIDEKLRGHYHPFFEMVRRMDERLNRMSDEEKELLARRFERFMDRLIERRDGEENPLLAEGES